MSSLRAAVKVAIQKGWIIEGQRSGIQTKIAKLYGYSRQRVSQMVREERLEEMRRVNGYQR